MAKEIQTNLFINGQYVPSSSGETLSIYNPSDETLVTDNVQIASEQDVDRAVDAAKKAFPTWRDTKGAKRGAIMLKLADLLEANLEELASLGRCLSSRAKEKSMLTKQFVAQRVASDGPASRACQTVHHERCCDLEVLCWVCWEGCWGVVPAGRGWDV